MLLTVAKHVADQVGRVDLRVGGARGHDRVDVADVQLGDMVYDALEAGRSQVLVDETSVQAKAGLSAPVEAVCPQLQSVAV